MSKNSLEVNSLSKVYYSSTGSKLVVLEDINLHIEFDKNRSSFYTILAPFGSGKTALLKILAGFEKYDGTVKLNEKVITEPNGEIIYISQNITSFPWLNVKENIEMPFKLNRQESLTSVVNYDEMVELIGLTDYHDYFTSSEKSGFRLRIALARALAFRPKLILLDDVFNGLDGETQIEIINLFKKLSNTVYSSFILATANVIESILLSQRIFLMRKNPGKIIKEIEVPTLTDNNKSEIITNKKHEIEESLKSQNMLNSVSISL